MNKPGGHLVIIGGAEDREYDKQILRRFVELAGGPSRSVVVITAASRVPDEVWREYDPAFGELGVRRRVHLDIASRAAADDAGVGDLLRDAGGIFISGGDQKRLLALIGGTALDRALHAAYTRGGACIGGTSAGASAMSQHMLAAAQESTHPAKGTVRLESGLALVRGIVIDQHFSERRRFPRLLTAVAQYPWLQGVGIDEDTALVIGRGAGIEVIGAGTVTVIDGRRMHSNLAGIDRFACPELVDVRLHLLPPGAQYRIGSEGAAPEPLRDLIDALAGLDPPMAVS